jgi:TadE-like protein
MRRVGRIRFGERGAAAVEMAIVVPVLVLLAFGMLEFGLAFKSKLDMAHAVNQATRNASVLGTDEYADIEILNALEAGLDGDLSNIVHVDIFQADADGAYVPGSYDRYVTDPGSCGWDPCPDPDEGSPTYGNPAGYEPCDRDIVLDADGVHTIGVQVEYTHSWITGVLGLSDPTWHETARARMEPDLVGAGSSCP